MPQQSESFRYQLIDQGIMHAHSRVGRAEKRLDNLEFNLYATWAVVGAYLLRCALQAADRWANKGQPG